MLTSDLGPGAPIGSLFPRADTSGALQGLCSNFNNAINTICINFVDGGIFNCDNTIHSITVICSDFLTFPIDSTAEVASNAKGKADAQTSADADTDLDTAVAAGDTVSAIQDICNTMQLFIDLDCDKNDDNPNDPKGSGICLMFGSAVNNACIDAISANST